MPDQGSFDFDAAAARAARDDAVARVDVGADPDWKGVAYSAVVEASLSGTFTTDDVWRVLDGWGVPRPREPRALAPVMLRAKKAGLISPTSEFRNSDRVVCHANPKRVWRAAALRRAS